MKKDQYIPHEVSMRSNSQVINLIETEGCAGYGIYWALLEYLRVQENYIGDLQALSSLKRQLKIRQSKLDKVLYGYDLFVCVGNTFYSPKYSKTHNELLRNDRFGLWQVKTKYRQALLFYGKYRKFAQECNESVYEYLS